MHRLSNKQLFVLLLCLVLAAINISIRPQSIFLPRREQRIVSLNNSDYVSDVRNARRQVDYYPSFGGLDMQFLKHESEMRHIPLSGDDDDAKVDGSNNESADSKDEMSKYLLAYYDDEYEKLALLEDTNQTSCTRRPWYKTIRPTCNSFHEIPVKDVLLDKSTKYIGGGSYRSVYLAAIYNNQQGQQQPEDLAWKTITLEDGITAADVGNFLMDGVVSAALTPNPHLANVYGFCGVSLWSEPVKGGDMEKFQPTRRCDKDQRLALLRAAKEGKPLSFNNLKPAEKITWALKMAQAVAVLHNYKGGTIVHADVALRQFLIDPTDNSVKLTDFNQAEALRRDENGKECMFHSQHSSGSHRPPEMYRSKHLANEKADIWGLGITFYSLLTGLGNFHDDCNARTNIKKRVKNGEIPWIDPLWKKNSPEEAVLVNVIQQCFAYDCSERIDINKVIQLLTDAQK